MRHLPVIAVLAGSLALSGCIGISATTSNQPSSMGSVELQLTVCANGAPGCSAQSNSDSAYTQADGSTVVPMQVLVAVRVPEGAVLPESRNGLLAGGVVLAFTRSASYEAELDALEPPPAGERWWAYVSAEHQWRRSGPQSLTVTFPTPLPRPADGGPYPSPLRWRPVVGARIVDTDLPAGRPVDCGTARADLYEGRSERNTASRTITCIDSPAPDATVGYVEAPITDFGFEGSPLTVPAGSTATALVLARRTGPADPGTTLQLTVAGGPPGATLTPDATSVSLGGDAAKPVRITVAVPPQTAPGDYPLTVTATAAGKPARSGTAVVTVTGTAPAPDTVAPVIGSASLSNRKPRRGRGTTVRLDLSEAADVTATVSRLRAGRRTGGRCRLGARRGRRCTKATRAGTTTAPLGPGAGALTVGTGLRPGRYRVDVVAADAAGNRSSKVRLPFRVRARRP